MTGVFNQRFIASCLREEIEAAHKEHKTLTVAMIDLDNFKAINDTYGHLYGDYVLKRIVNTIKGNLRQNDILGRYGGDEFLIILRDTSIEEGFALIESIRREVLDIEWESDIELTLGGGVVEVANDDLTSLLEQVDQLLYRAKHKGKNQIEKASQARGLS
ncbi:MAG: GGDEF domain-containing protein [Firmicutes bacterium]|nr:GGDEF domain-containing protein [Bacillota bacterium]